MPHPAGPAMAAELIRQFQQVMQQFLHTQQSVVHDLINAYVGGASASATTMAPVSVAASTMCVTPCLRA